MTLNKLTTSISSSREGTYTRDIHVKISADNAIRHVILYLHYYLTNGAPTFYAFNQQSKDHQIKVSSIETLISILNTQKSDMLVFFKYGKDLSLQIANGTITINEFSIKYNKETIDSLISVFTCIYDAMPKMQERNAVSQLAGLKQDKKIKNLTFYYKSKYASEKYKEMFREIFSTTDDTTDQLKKELEQAKQNQCDIHSLQESFTNKVEELQAEIKRLNDERTASQGLAKAQRNELNEQKRKEINDVCEKYMELLREAETKQRDEIEKKVRSECKEQVRNELYNELYSEVRKSLESINNEIRKQQQPLIECEVRNQLQDDLYEQERERVIEKIRDEETDNLKQEIKEDMYEDLKRDLYNEVQEELYSELLHDDDLIDKAMAVLLNDDKLIAEVKVEMRAEFHEELTNDDRLITQVKQELMKDEELIAQVKAEIKKELKSENTQAKSVMIQTLKQEILQQINDLI